MSDRELLEKAAKSIGHELHINLVGAPQLRKDGEYVCFWNPLTDDGDVFRLAVKKTMSVRINTLLGVVEVSCGDGPVGNRVRERLGDDHVAATRRAIVRAAAALAGDKGDPNGNV